MISFSFKKLIIPTIIFFSIGLFLFGTPNEVKAQSNDSYYNPATGAYTPISNTSTLKCADGLVPNSDNTAFTCPAGKMFDTSPIPGTVGAVFVDEEDAFQANITAGNRVNPQPTTSTENASCSGIDNFFKNPIACSARGLGYAVLNILAFLVSLAGQVFDFSTKFSILEMGTLIGSADNGINIAWSTIRDLGNIIFIFMLLWVSIMNILQMGDAKKFIPTLIIAALLVNFSLFFTKVIIDTSNIVAVQF